MKYNIRIYNRYDPYEEETKYEKIDFETLRDIIESHTTDYKFIIEKLEDDLNSDSNSGEELF